MTETFINPKKCNGCEVCLQVCPVNAIILRDNIAYIQETCTDCGLCIDACPEEAIGTKEEEGVEYRGILFFGEVVGGKPDVKTLLALERTRELARELGVYVVAVLAGTDIEGAAQDLISYGANEVIVAKSTDFQNYDTQNILTLLTRIIDSRKPEAVVFADSFAARDLGPRLAQRFQTSFVASCTDLAVEERERKIVQTRLFFGGKVTMRLLTTVAGPQIFSVRAEPSGEPEKADFPRGEIIEWTDYGIP
ncbi:MAG: 4Fe-4S binding protein [Thermoplasmata archaeon]